MKILMINSVCGIKSTGRICTDLAQELEKQGNTVKIAYGRETVPEEYKKYAVRIGNNSDVMIHGGKARLFDASGFGSKLVTKKFVRWIQEYNPDVIHLHNLHGYYINIGVLFEYLKEANKKVIWTLHDCWAFTGHSALCDGIQCERWKKGCFDCPQKGEYPRTLRDNSEANWKRKKKILTGVSNMTIVTPSNWLANCVKESFLNCYKIQVIHNGIDTLKFHSQKSDFKEKYRLNNKFIILGVASTWNNLKGYRDFIKLSQILDETYQIILVGVSDKQRRKLPKRIIGIRRTNSIEELVDIYNAADVFLNLSYCDTYPTVILEALCCGVPVITYNTGGSPECIVSENGIIVQRGQIEEVAKKIEKSKSEKTLDGKMISRYDKKRTLQLYLKLIDD